MTEDISGHMHPSQSPQPAKIAKTALRRADMLPHDGSDVGDVNDAAFDNASDNASAAESPLRTVTGLAALLYRMGRTFDGLNTTRMATEEFLRTGNPKVIGSKNDYALLQDLRDASAYVLDTDWRVTHFDLAWFTGINARLRRTAAMEPGVLRESSNVIVSTPEGAYTPPVPDAAELQSVLDDAAGVAAQSDVAEQDGIAAQSSAVAQDSDPLQRASRLFAQMAKAQPFGDGNKRSALLAANGLLLREEYPASLSVPADEPERSDFNSLLGRWYLSDDAAIIAWLSAWNRERPAD